MADEERPKEPQQPTAFSDSVRERLFKARTLIISGEINQQLASQVIAQLIALSIESEEPIDIFINSQGGHVESGDTIHDVIRFIRPEVKMIGTGWVTSAGALIYVAAKKENRFALPNTRFLLHQPLGGMRGPASDIEIEAAQILAARERLNRIFAEATGQDPAKIAQETERNLWMTAQQAREYGLVHRVIANAREI